MKIYPFIKISLNVHIVKQRRDSNDILPWIDMSKNLIMLYLSSFPLFLQLRKPSDAWGVFIICKYSIFIGILLYFLIQWMISTSIWLIYQMWVPRNYHIQVQFNRLHTLFNIVFVVHPSFITDSCNIRFVIIRIFMSSLTKTFSPIYSKPL